MSRRVLALALATELAIFVTTHTASAQRSAPADVARAEAHDRFDRGLALFDQGDDAGALVEFQRAYQLVENPVVLFNIGLVLARMGRSVEAIDALDNVLSHPGTLSPERRALARRVRGEQALRVAAVAIVANVTGARIEIDGIDAGTTPIAWPLRVLSGTHVISVDASGFLPERKVITMAGGDKQEVRFNLVAARLSHLVVNTHLPGASLLLDNQLIGTTPLNASISVAPGTHSVELQRKGYWPASTSVTVDEGATAEVMLEPDEDASTSGSFAGVLSLALNEESASFIVDGRRRGLYRAPLRLPAGTHRVQVVRDEFMPFERDVDVPRGEETTLRVTLVPSTGYVMRYSSRARRQRAWTTITLAGGALTLAGSAALLVYDTVQRNQWSSTVSSLRAANQFHSGKPCDAATQDANTLGYQQSCVDPLNAAIGHVNDANTRDYFGWSAFGLGLAAAALSVVLFVTGDDPHKYDDSKSASQPGFPYIFPSIGAVGRSRGLMTAWSF